MSVTAKHQLVERRDHAEWELVEALNLPAKHAKTPGEVEALRDRLQEARKACIEAGLDDRTFMERAAELQLETIRNNEERVRRLASEHTHRQDRLPRRARLGAVAAMTITVGALLLSWSATSGQVFMSLIGAFSVFVLANSLLAKILPTKAIRVGKLSADLDVEIRDLYQVGSVEMSDYLWAMEDRRIWRKAWKGSSPSLRYRYRRH